MWRVTLRGLAAKKFRLILTSISIVLGVAFMAGTFVLTDTLGGVFDGLFAKTTKGVDVVVRSRLPYEASGPGSNQRDTRPPVPASVVDTVGGIPGVEGVQGNLLGYALVIGTDGKEVGTQAPTFGLPWYPARTSVNQSLAILKGRQARTASEVTLDYQTFVKGGFSVGDRVRISFLTVPPREFILTGVFSFGGSKEGLAGANDDTMVTPIPTTNDTMMVRGTICSEPPGRSMPNALSSASRGLTIAIPSATPSTEERSPTTNASPRIDPFTWRPEAPRARSRPISRMRCATVIENVL